MKNVVAIGAHPDDIEPQIGGTLLRYHSNGDRVYVIILTDTETDAVTSTSRNQEAKEGALALGAHFISVNINQNKFLESRENIRKLDKILKEIKPNIVFTMSANDSHNDHRTTFDIVYSASRKNNFSLIEVAQAIPGGVNPQQYNFFSIIDGFEEQKYDAVRAHRSQMNKYGPKWLEAIKARDRAWGYHFDAEFAEVGKIIKWIEPFSQY